MIRLTENRLDVALAKLWSNEPPTTLSGSVFVTNDPVTITLEAPYYLIPLGMTYMSPFNLFKAFVSESLQDLNGLIHIQRALSTDGGGYMATARSALTFEVDGAEDRVDATLYLSMLDDLGQLAALAAMVHHLEAATGANLTPGTLTIRAASAAREERSFIRTPRAMEPEIQMFEPGQFRNFVNNASLVIDDDVMGVRDRWIRRVLVPIKAASDAIESGPAHRERALDLARSIDDGRWRELMEDWIEFTAVRMKTEKPE